MLERSLILTFSMAPLGSWFILSLAESNADTWFCSIPSAEVPAEYNSDDYWHTVEYVC